MDSARSSPLTAYVKKTVIDSRFLIYAQQLLAILRSGATAAMRGDVVGSPCFATLRALIAALLVAGCAHNAPAPEHAAVDVPAPDGAIAVPANRQWIETDVDVQVGEVVTVVARGRIVAQCSDKWGNSSQSEVGPDGTYFFNDGVASQTFPLPSGAAGPAPCFSLIGRVGDGPPFYVGQQKSWTAKRSGRLSLGINDFDVSENTGQFFAEITKPSGVQPIAFEEVVIGSATPGPPKPNCSVVVFYIDGLRPDVVREMAAMGHIPSINRLFLKGGTWLSNTFTAFPSDTITSNGTMWTGCFSDRHGLKEHIRFSRRRLASESYLEPLGPNRSARLLSPQGVDRLLQKAQAASRKLIHGEDDSRNWLKQQTTGVPPLYQHLRNRGSDWATGVLPLMTEVPPLMWTRSMSRQMPYFRSQEAWKYIDDANALYAVRHLLQRNSPVTVIWLPETDSVSHKQCRGQFGMTRRTIAQADVLVGQVVAEIEAAGRIDQTYFMLVSDHGHHGGRETHLSHFDIANELFFKPREMSPDGRWLGGGLGLSVKQHRFENRHRGDAKREFVFVDADSDGVARIFLPKGHFRSGDWSGPNQPDTLLNYKIDEHLPALNLVNTMCATLAAHGGGDVQMPIDLVLAKLSENSVLVATADRGFAIIDRKRNTHGHWSYRYSVVRNVKPAGDGAIAFEHVDEPYVDPLGLLQRISIDELKDYYDEQAWLLATAGTAYPDSVVALTRHMLWQKNIQGREMEYAPDLVVTAKPGWYFGNKSSPGTMHGYPFADAMRASWFVSGPNIRRGARVNAPCRLVDLTPTILDMVGVPAGTSEFDGRPIRDIYESKNHLSATVAQPVYWQDVDLQAWQPLRYTPLRQYEHLPLTVNHPASAFDLNNVAYNVLTVADWSVFRLFDDMLSPLSSGKQRVTRAVERTDQRVRHAGFDWVTEGAHVLHVPDTVLSDYSLTSLGNLKRADGLVDWAQQRTRNLDARVAKKVGRSSLPGSDKIHRTVDNSQVGFWELYRFAQRVVIEVVDETILSGLEDGTDKAINAFRSIPSEVTVEPAEQSTIR